MSGSSSMNDTFHGPRFLSDKEVSFQIWAPNAKKMDLELEFTDRTVKVLQMRSLDHGYFEVTTHVSNGLNYGYLIDGITRRPDPASRYQPAGVHGNSSIVSSCTFEWNDDGWIGVPLSDLIVYELHVGAFSSEGTFESVIDHLDYLKDLGITAIELMPVAQFPGTRNWGYDGVDLYAPQNSYGGPEGLKKLVDACHTRKLGILLDVVYNHLGPEGNYLPDFGPYFSYKYRTPWGPAINFDEGGSDEVRKFYIQNAVYWIQEYHFDGLRLDAVDRIYDSSPKHILTEINEKVHEASETVGREVHVIAESDSNDPKILRSREIGGYSLDSQWSDDFHHAVHSYLTAENFSHYADFGSIESIAKALTSSFVYDGKYSSFRSRSHGSTSFDLNGDRFVQFIQNHDQVGNHPNGARLSSLIPLEKLKVAVALLIFSQSVPLLFMGEEYAEDSPFLFFTSHADEEIVRATREGRKKEHSCLAEKLVDPQSESSFVRSKLDHALRNEGRHRLLLDYYRDLISLRKRLRPLRDFGRKSQEILLLKDKKTIIAKRSVGQDSVECIFALGTRAVELDNPARTGFKLVFDSRDYKEGSKTSERDQPTGKTISVESNGVLVFAN